LGKTGKPRTKISSDESQRIEQQEDPMKYLHGVVAVHRDRATYNSLTSLSQALTRLLRMSG